MELKYLFSNNIKNNIENVTIDSRDIYWNPNDQTVKYLGVYLVDTKLGWKFHINKNLNLANVTEPTPAAKRYKSKLKAKSCILL